MKRFCIGHFKTGTMSYSRAMRMLGLVDLHFPPRYMLQLALNGRVEPWTLKPWDSMSNAHEVEYEEVDALYPDAQFILTTRAVEGWLKSIRHHMGQRWPKDMQALFDGRFQKLYGVPCQAEAFEELRFRRVFQQHDEAVRDYFAGSDRLLVLDLAGEDLMKKLSDFVGVAPAYPHANKRGEPRKPGQPLIVGGPSQYAKAG